ncbi:MAG: hypothetical protein ABIQ88_05945 [Chitinophagaceae bacterium]
MQLIKPVLSGSLFLFLNITANTQDKIYLTTGVRDGKTEAVTASTTTYRPSKKDALPVITTTPKTILLFNKNGSFLVPAKMDFGKTATQQMISQFIQTPVISRDKDELYMLSNGRIDDIIISEDNKYIYITGPAGRLAKKTIAAIVYRDGHHILLAPAAKVAVILWSNKPVTALPAQTLNETITTPPPSAAAASLQKPVADTPKALSFEQVAGNISKESFEKKALQKTNQLNIYLKVICDKAANYEEINKAIDQSVGLFVDENAMIETSSVSRNDIKRYKIRNYLSHIKLVNYDKIEIEWTNVQYVSDVKQAPDGNYYGVVSFEQVFRGYRDGKLIYQDVTRKNATVILKTYEKNIDGNTQNIWDVLLSDIGVISTKSL